MNTQYDGLIAKVEKKERKKMKLRLTSRKWTQIIVLGATLSAIGRWIPSLLAAEGFAIPESWLDLWLVLAIFLNTGMGLVEAFAFAYIAKKLGRKIGFTQKVALGSLALFAAAMFVIVQTPYLATQVTGTDLVTVLSLEWMAEHWLVMGWCASVVLATISIVAGVAYAEMVKPLRH
jgi:hypothetical protein